MNLYKVLQQQGHHEQGTATQYTHSTEIVSSRNSQQGNSKQVVQTIITATESPKGELIITYQPKSIKPHKGLKYSLKNYYHKRVQIGNNQIFILKEGNVLL